MMRIMKSNINNIKFLYVFTLLSVASFANETCFSQPVKRDIIEQPVYLSGKNTLNNINRNLIFQSLPPNFEYNGVTCILKDYKGYMWFGTIDGLIRYDGINLYVYENDPDDSTSLSHSAVNALVEDKNNNLWIGTASGLNKYNRDKDNFIHVGSINVNLIRLNDSYISALCSDKKSLLWVGTFDGVNVYNPEKQLIYHYSYNIDDPNSVSSNRITAIAIDGEDNIWLGTQNGLNLFSDTIEGFRHFCAEQGNRECLSNNNITSLAVDLEGNVWVGTRGGGINKLIKRNGDFLFERFYSNSQTGSLSNNFVLSLNADKRGYLWIGTENGGLNRLQINTGLIKVFKVEEGNNHSLSSNSIWALYSDNEDRLWIGTHNKGINVIDENFSKFESFQKNPVNKFSLTDNDVTGFAEDNRGNVWIATDGGGICRFDPETRRFNKILINSEGNNFLANNAIKAILYDSRENLWIGTWAGGIDRLNKNGVKIENYNIETEQGGGNNNILCLYEDSKGNIWTGTAGSGLFKYNTATNKFDQVNCSDRSDILTESAYVSSMLEDSEGSFWVSTLYGMVILKSGPDHKYSCINFSRAGNSPTLSSNAVEVIFEDREKRLWFGTTDNGLNLFNRKDSTFTVFQRKDGLPSNSIRGILEDDTGFLWIMTNKGITKFHYDSASFVNYDREDGLNSNEFYVRSCLRTKKGEFYLGGENGFNIFYPENIKNNHFIPPVYLTNLKINNITAEIQAENSPLEKNIGETAEVTLNHRQSSFTIDFVALNYTRSARNQFSYKLVGFDGDWNYTGNNRSASYTNIKPGKYVFMVKGSNNDGIWNNTPTSLIINIKPPYWKRWWSILVYILFISGIIAVSLKIWNERVKIKHQLKLEHLAREKEHELNEKNIQFFTSISHEFRTPLSLIIAPLESLILSAQSKIKEQLAVIYRNAQRLLHLTNNLMDLRKLEEGRPSLKVRNGEIVSFIREVSSYFHADSKRRQINFNVIARESIIHGWFDPDKLETILLNLLSNAFKYTSDNGRIKINVNTIDSKDIEVRYNPVAKNVNLCNKYVEIAVFDNGRGIIPEELPFVFEKFYQSKLVRNKKDTGTGIGLALTKGLVELHHGFIKAESIPDCETCFTLALPVDPDAYLEDEIESEPTSTLKKNILDVPEKYMTQKNKIEMAESDQRLDKAEVLIVEDNYELRTFLAKELGEEFNIIQAEDGKAGIELAFKNIPDLIVSDILMPQCSGVDLCRIVKTDIRTCHIPVILLTAKTTINDQIEGVKIGADAYITKPFNMQYLYVQIDQLIRSRRKMYAHFSQDVYIMPNKFADNEMDQNFIRKAIDYIVSNMTDNTLDVEGLAAELNLCRSNVYRKIKALTGKTTIEFIRIVRLKQAIKLMEAKKYTLAEIAYLTGFTSPSYFTKSFKDQYGRPPSDYLAQ
jgi:ligand-binding sensor domain-containing protein/signal transduction histidine kinase/DNA-binding response OmpR family regulator